MLSGINVYYPKGNHSNKKETQDDQDDTPKKKAPTEENNNDALESILNKESSIVIKQDISLTLLENLNGLIQNKDLSNEKLLDILFALHGAIKSNESDYVLERLFQIHQSIINHYNIHSKTHKQLLRNIVQLYKQIQKNKTNSNNFDRKFLLLLEHFLMKDQQVITQRQLQIVMSLLRYALQKTTPESIFSFSFLFLKIFEIINTKKYTKLFKIDLIILKEDLIKRIPLNSEGLKLKKVISSKQI